VRRLAQALTLLLVFTSVLMSPGLPARADSGVHTTYLWHMHQPIYWPTESGYHPGRYETAYETITTGHSQNDEFSIFNLDDRVAAYQWSPHNAVNSIRDLPDAGAQLSFAGALIENINSLGQAGWNGGRYAANWYQQTRTAMGWTTSGGHRRLEPVLVGFHHAIGPLLDDNALRMELAIAREIWGDAWGAGPISRGFFPAEMCFSPRMIPALADAGVDWAIVPDIHLARACANYPYTANLDNCDPPNRADQVNPAQTDWTAHTISRGVTVKVPYPFGFTPQRLGHVDPVTGQTTTLVGVPMSNAMSWDEGYGFYGTGDIDAMAHTNDPQRPMLVVFAHDGDNAWSGGYSYYHESVTQFAHAAAGQGYSPTTIAQYLADHPVPASPVVHVEDGGWVNADGDFGSPQFINWNWPLVNAAGQFDIPGGWAEDQWNWAVLTAAQNRVETAAAIQGAVDPAKVMDPLSGANPAERAWHFLLAGYESGYMYYGTSLDMEIKASMACNQATALADPLIAGGADTVAPTIWLPQRLPWNPGGKGGGSLWGWPGGEGEQMSSDFHVWTFAHDVSGLVRVDLMVREDSDGVNDPATTVNETYAGGSGVSSWLAVPMNHRVMPTDEPWDIPGVDLTVTPTHIADEYWLELTGYSEILLDYYIEAEDSHGNIKRTPIQHVWVGEQHSNGGGGGDFVMDGQLDASAQLLGQNGDASLWAHVDENLLYVATDAHSERPAEDTFLLVGWDQGQRGAPWAKTGQALLWNRFLAREQSNGWAGWFDQNEAVLEGKPLAAGTVLEGVIDLDEVYGSSWPAEVFIAVGCYGSADGGALHFQVPTGNGDGDGDLEFPEYAPFALRTSAVAELPGTGVGFKAWPNPFNARLSLLIEGQSDAPVHCDIFDARGRRVSRLTGMPVGGIVTLSWDGRDELGQALPSGPYFLRAGSGLGLDPTVKRVMLVK
jgi:hypothetical protein